MAMRDPARSHWPPSVFKIGSVTKVFTATLLADMVSRGEAKLDDPAQMYAPAGLVLPQRNGKQITLAHLAEQMSGLPREAPNRPVNAAGPSYAALTKDMLYDLLKSYQLPRSGRHLRVFQSGFRLVGLHSFTP